MHNPAQLQKLLLVGTARARLGPDMLPPELAAVLTPALDAPGATPERQLWLATGAQRLWTRAGYAPPSAVPAASTVPSAPEQLPACPHAAEAILKRLLGGSEPAALLREWLQLLHRRQARLPERFLPNMLERATQDPTLRPGVRGTLGMRGGWLARHESAWSWAYAALDAGHVQATWENGTPDERIAALQAWRRIDPAAAREGLQSCWASEPPEQRIAFLPCLGINLDAGDESFLESALDDRRKGVRVAAQGLLARLPGSALSQRMRARVTPLLQLEKRLLRGTRLNVTLPETCDAAMARDGVGDGKHAGLGEKAGWLADMLSVVDPSHWSTAFGLPPDECIALAAHTDYRQALLVGWTAGMHLHLARAASPDLLAWLASWTRIWLKSDGTTRYQNLSSLAGAYAALPPAAMHAALLALVEQSRTPWLAADAPLAELLEQIARKSDTSWPAPLSQAIAVRLLGGLPAMPGQQWSLRSVLQALAIVLDPDAVLAAERAWPGLGDDVHGWRTPLEHFFHVVRFRHEMILSFQEHA